MPLNINRKANLQQVQLKINNHLISKPARLSVYKMVNMKPKSVRKGQSYENLQDFRIKGHEIINPNKII